MQSKWVAGAIAPVRRLGKSIDAAVQDRGWLVGDAYTLDDADLSVYAYRLGQMSLDCLWDDLPAFQRWRERAHARPAFKAGVADWLTDAELGKYDLGAHKVVAAAKTWMAQST